MEVKHMTNSIKKNLFKQFIQERCNEHIEAVKSNVLNEVITLAEAQSLIAYEPIAYSIEQQSKYAKATGGIKIGQALFIGNQDLKFVTPDYFNETLDTVIKDLDINTILQELEDIDATIHV
jgi:hypothetical protein